MINWNKSGCIFKAQGQFPFMLSHTAMCIPMHLHDNIYRIYFSTRGERNNPQVGYIEIDLNEPDKILTISENAALENGQESYFDFNGLYSGCIVKRENELWMYYSGRTNLENGMYHVSAGLAISNDNGLSFQKFSHSPIHQRNIHDPWLVSTPFVMPYLNGWRMYYLSGRKITRFSDTDYSSHYDIRSAFSVDGIEWKSENKIHIPMTETISNIAAPNILKISDSKYLMTYSYVENNNGYQLGAAYSENLNDWTVCNHLFKDLAASSWEKTRAYPCSFIHQNQFYMVYGGHNYGKEGMGLAHVNLSEILEFIEKN